FVCYACVQVHKEGIFNKLLGNSTAALCAARIVGIVERSANNTVDINAAVCPERPIFRIDGGVNQVFRDDPYGHIGAIGSVFIGFLVQELPEQRAIAVIEASGLWEALGVC